MTMSTGTLRRKINRHRYNEQAYFKWSVLIMGVDPKLVCPNRDSIPKQGKSWKVSSSQRNVNFTRRHY